MGKNEKYNLEANYEGITWVNFKKGWRNSAKENNLNLSGNKIRLI
jgi:hypothetical protein